MLLVWCLMLFVWCGLGAVNSVGQVASFVVLCSFVICVDCFMAWLLPTGLVMFWVWLLGLSVVCSMYSGGFGFSGFWVFWVCCLLLLRGWWVYDCVV